MKKKAAEEYAVRKAAITPEETAANAFKYYLERYNTAIYHSEAIECVEDMMEYLTCDNAAALIRKNPSFREVVRIKIRQFMEERPTPRLAFTLGMLQQKYFA